MAERAAGTAKKATGTRATPRKKAVDIDFDADTDLPGRKRFTFRLGGQEWKAKQPNIAVLAEIEERSEETGNALIGLMGELAEFIDPAQRAAFLATLKDLDDFSIDRLIDIRTRLQKLVHGDLPTGASSD